MDIFLEKHRDAILGVVEGFDRVIFKGYLRGCEKLSLQRLRNRALQAQ